MSIPEQWFSALVSIKCGLNSPSIAWLSADLIHVRASLACMTQHCAVTNEGCLHE